MKGKPIVVLDRDSLTELGIETTDKQRKEVSQRLLKAGCLTIFARPGSRVHVFYPPGPRTNGAGRTRPQTPLVVLDVDAVEMKTRDALTKAGYLVVPARPGRRVHLL